MGRGMRPPHTSSPSIVTEFDRTGRPHRVRVVMKKMLALVIAVVGFALIGWSAAAYFATKTKVYGYHPMYPGLVGIALFTGGLIGRQD